MCGRYGRIGTSHDVLSPSPQGGLASCLRLYFVCALSQMCLPFRLLFIGPMHLLCAWGWGGGDHTPTEGTSHLTHQTSTPALCLGHDNMCPSVTTSEGEWSTTPAPSPDPETAVVMGRPQACGRISSPPVTTPNPCPPPPPADAEG